MLELKNVTKIYGKKKQTVALDDVSFTLPDRGFIFIVGKSGCGKSTLLNMMGGCDKLTGGDIIVDGNMFSLFSERDFDNFRNDYVGFIFQDYCLLERLTVRQNVALALQLQGIEDDTAVDAALAQVDMSEYSDRLPDQLSGGQKQRVAVARTLVKHPRLILADEPTGNLDAKSTNTVLDLLKGLSETTLVVIVSHDRADAEKYADRIIELSDGKIIGDISRNPEAQDIVFDTDGIIIQRGTVFSDEQISAINSRTSSNAVAFRQVETRFLPTVAEKDISPSYDKKIEHKKASPRGKRTLFHMLARKRAVSMALTALSVVFIIAVLGICQFFTMFSANDEISRLVSQSDSNKTFILRKGYYESELNTTPITTRYTSIPDSDIEQFRSTGYEGGIYPLYNVSIMTHVTGDNIAWGVEAYNPPVDAQNYAKFFCGTGLGVLVTNENFLTKLYGGEDGKLKLLSGDLDTKGDEVILTDYIADSIIAYSPWFLAEGDDPYATITNGALHFERYRVAGVIDTGYKERYASIMSKMLDGTFALNRDAEEYGELLTELNSTLNIAYSFNPDFYKEYSTDNTRRSIYYGTMELSYDGRTIINQSYSYPNDGLKPDEVLLARSVYASLMDMDIRSVVDSEAVGKKITLTRYNFVRNENDSPDYTLEVTIAGILDDVNGVGGFNCSPEIYALLQQYGNAPYALYFDDMSKVMELYDMSADLAYVVNNPLVSTLYTVSNAALVFTDVFTFIAIVLVALAAVMLASFGAGSVRKNMYEIAVIRALGGKTRDLTFMFLLQMLLVSIVVCVLSVAAMAVGADVCNSMLADGFVRLAHNVFMRQLHVITFRWSVALFDAAAVLVLTAIAACVPMLIIRRSKPREIIRAKE